MNRTSKTKSLSNRAAIAAIFGIAGIVLGTQAIAQAQDAAPDNAVAALPAKDAAPDAVPDAAPSVVPTVVVGSEGLIIATVNDEPITEHDMDERMALDLSQWPTRPTDEDKARLREQEKTRLENEMLQIQEARSQSITVSVNEVEKRIEQIAQSTNRTVAQLETAMNQAGTNLDTLRRKIQVDLAWMRTVEAKYQEDAAKSISPADVDAEMERIAESANKPHYHVREIVLAVNNPADDAKVKKAAQVIIDQLKQGGNFGAIARQFSENPSAASDGDIGIVYEGQYAPELIKALADLKPDQITQEPVKANGSYYILYLQERFEPVGTVVPPSPTLAETKQTQLPLVRILLATGPQPTKEFVAAAMKAANDIKTSQAVCGPELKSAIQKMGAVYDDLGTVTLTDMSNEIQQALQPTRSGEIADPIVLADGVNVIVRCDNRQEVLTPFVMPARSDIEFQLYQDRLTTWARRYQRDLRRNADIADVKPN